MTLTYVVSSDSRVLGEVWQLLNASPLAAAFTAACTLVGVASLGYEVVAHLLPTKY